MHSSRFARVTSLIACGVVSCCLGCSGSLGAKVSGTVTVGDKPLTSGTVTFTPESGNGAVGYGTIDSQGKYSLSTGTAAGIAPGKYKVTVVATGPMPPEVPGQPPPPPPRLTPEKYASVETTDLSAEVKAGQNTVPLKLEAQ